MVFKTGPNDPCEMNWIQPALAEEFASWGRTPIGSPTAKDAGSSVLATA